MGLPLLVHLPPFYASLGLSLSVVGTIFLIARLWDMVTDPILGILSDRFETRWGRRRHWIVLSVPIMMVSVFMVFIPQGDVTAFYLIFWLLILFVGWTMLTLSHLAWGAELSPDYFERSRIQGWRELLLIIGMLLVLMLPAIIENALHPEDLPAARAMAMGVFVLVTLPIAVAIAVTQVGERKTPPPKRVPMRQAIAIIGQNQPLRYVLICDLLGGISGGLVTSMFLFLVEDVLQLAQYASLMLLGYFTAGVIFVMPILALTKRIGKHRALAASSAFNAVSILIILAVPPGHPIIAMAVWTALGVNMAAGPFLFRSIMADVADHDQVHSHQQRTGVFFAMLTMTSKLGAALAIFSGYWVLDQIGFVPGAENTASTLEALRLFYVWPAVIVSALVALIMWRFPIDENAQAENRAILEARGVDVLGAAIESGTLEPGPDVPMTRPKGGQAPAD